MRSLRHAALVIALLCAPAGIAPAAAADDEPISVKVNMARILRIATPAATVIVGNPGVADVAIQDPQTLVLTGKSFGQTNLIVLDDMGTPIADTMVDVIQAQANLMTVFQGTQRQTMVCNPVCQPMIMLGDDVGYTSVVVNSKGIVAGAAR